MALDSPIPTSLRAPALAYSDLLSCSAIPDFRFAFVQTQCQTPTLFRAIIKRSSDLKSCRAFSVSRLSFVHAHLSVPMSFRASPAAISDTVSCRRYAEGRLHFVQSYSQLPTRSRASPIPISDLLSCKLRLRPLAPNADCSPPCVISDTKPPGYATFCVCPGQKGVRACDERPGGRERSSGCAAAKKLT